jgi:hypothetical protein
MKNLTIFLCLVEICFVRNYICSVQINNYAKSKRVSYFKKMRPTPKKWYIGPNGRIYRNNGVPGYLQDSIYYNLPEAKRLQRLQRIIKNKN